MVLCRVFLLMLSIALTAAVRGQDLYFPPVSGSEWQTMSLEEAELCEEGVDSLYDYLDEMDTKAFILLKDGKIVLEKYFGTFVQDSFWYWASAGKTLTAFAVGMAQEEGYLDIDEPSNLYLGQGWTSTTPTQEEAITIWHHLTMTSGLDDGVPDNHCTLDTCLVYKTDPGTRWAYHNAPYTLLDEVISNATGQSLNLYINSVLKSRIGMNGLFIPNDYNNLFVSTARSMARFGLLVLNKGVWDTDTIMHDRTYFDAMVNTSQELNKSYGYLWWLNGKETFKLPGLQFDFEGPMTPSAPDDMFAGVGKYGQLLNVVPSQNLVFVRMGNGNTLDAVPAIMNEEIWSRLNAARCNTTSTPSRQEHTSLIVAPNPASSHLTIQSDLEVGSVVLYDMKGRVCLRSIGQSTIPVDHLHPGIYVARIDIAGTNHFARVVIR